MKNYIIKIKQYIGFLPIGIRLVNWFFQVILRIDYQCKFSKNFTSRVQCPDKISFGQYSNSTFKSFALSGGCYIQAFGGIRFGNNTYFGPNVAIVSANHSIEDLSKFEVKGPIIIGDNCWIGNGVTVTSGVELGNRTIVAAGAVVTKSFPEGNCIIGGIPAEIIKYL